jgi:hypothetical protein
MGFWIAASADWSSALAAILRFTTHSSVSVIVIPRFSFRRNLQAWCFWRIPGLQQSLAHKIAADALQGWEPARHRRYGPPCVITLELKIYSQGGGGMGSSKLPP